MRTKYLLSSALMTLAVFCIIFSGCAPEEPVEKDTRELFFNNLKDRCGETFQGYVDHDYTAEAHEFLGASLSMHIEYCTQDTLLIPFYVNNDSSRTWVITLDEQGLLLKHDHRLPDGTPDDITMYGGWATEEGTPDQQAFPADEFTAELIPEASTNVWTLTINEEQEIFVYNLERDNERRFRAVFDLRETDAEYEE